MEWGRSVEMQRECDPDAQQAGGVPVVVRGRENLLQGEEGQFKKLEGLLLDSREVKTFDNQGNAVQAGNMVAMALSHA